MVVARRSLRRLLVVGGAVLVVLATGGATFAFWSGTGHGEDSGSTGTNVAVVLGPGTPVADLYPGGTTDVVLTVDNPNPAPVTIASLTLDETSGDGGFEVDAAHSACAVSALGFTSPTEPSDGWVVPGRSGTVHGSRSITLPDSLAMDLDAANACQGATITVYLRVGP